tara:strand:- start:107 stop:343 length:237 start_codon:yes stop_codon:yes gene_type:complete
MKKDRYGMLLDDKEIKLLERSLKQMCDNVKSIVGSVPTDLKRLLNDVKTIQKAGYMKTADDSNIVSEEDYAKICEECE